MNPSSGQLSAIEISRKTKLLPIEAVAAKVGIKEEDLEFYGKTKAKISLDLYRRLQDAPTGKLILVTAIHPTPAGEGKTTTSIGIDRRPQSAGQENHPLPARTGRRTVLWRQGRRHRRRLRPGRADGGDQSAFQRGFPRRHLRPQPAGGDARQPSALRQRPGHRPAPDCLAAGHGHERTRACARSSLASAGTATPSRGSRASISRRRPRSWPPCASPNRWPS